ncbi:MAG: cytochrome b [Hyphomicrobium sp.]|nr:cytochrome b [Hyphomicrobium sp.]PPD05935.1 MAG: cytochrome B [Hyphomicrobium sp.]
MPGDTPGPTIRLEAKAMTDHAAVPRYSLSMIRLHWLTLILVVAAYCFMEFREIFPRNTPGREFMKATHYSMGLTILGLTLARLIIKFTGKPAPAITPAPAPWQHMAAKAGHAAIYLFLIAMPLIGWATLSTEGDAVIFYGLEIPALLGPDKILSGRLEELHEIGGKIGYVLLGGHALLAILHHAVFKDTTLIRMMPKRAG